MFRVKCKNYLNSKVLRTDFEKKVIIKEQVYGKVLRTNLLRKISNIANPQVVMGTDVNFD